MTDIPSLMKVLKMMHLKESINLQTDTHENMVTKVIYQQAVLKILDTLEGIENGTIDIKDLLK